MPTSSTLRLHNLDRGGSCPSLTRVAVLLAYPIDPSWSRSDSLGSISLSASGDAQPSLVLPGATCLLGHPGFWVIGEGARETALHRRRGPQRVTRTAGGVAQASRRCPTCAGAERCCEDQSRGHALRSSLDELISVPQAGTVSRGRPALLRCRIEAEGRFLVGARSLRPAACAIHRHANVRCAQRHGRARRRRAPRRPDRFFPPAHACGCAPRRDRPIVRACQRVA